MTDRPRSWQDETGDASVLGVARIAIGVMLFVHALRAARELETFGYFGDVFHVPFIPERLVASRLLYTLIVAIELSLAVCVAIGLRAKVALFLSSLLGTYVLLCDRVQFHHNRWALLCFAFLLSLSPCDRAHVITGAPPGAKRVGALWAQRLAQLQLSIIYLASGGSKLADPDWRDGLVIAERFALYGHQAIARGVPHAVVDFMSQPLVTSGLAKVAIATELFLAIGLWQRRTRVFALWWGMMFHLTIEVTSSVEIFTWLTLSIYALFATPDYHARTLFYDGRRARGKITARIVSVLDWLSRFEIKAWGPDALKGGHAIVVVRRDGTRATGVRAIAMLARTIPIFFPLWLPLAIVASFTKRGDMTERG
jgi:uncharacterized membrane protein YphA (DoxX/SURF4 family)